MAITVRKLTIRSLVLISIALILFFLRTRISTIIDQKISHFFTLSVLNYILIGISIVLLLLGVLSVKTLLNMPASHSYDVTVDFDKNKTRRNIHFE